MSDSLKQVRFLSKWLMVSGSLNIILLFFVIYNSYQPVQREGYLIDEEEPFVEMAVLEESKLEVLKQFEKASFKQLIQKLQNQEHIEEGYTQRDLALSALVAFHHFDLKKALLGLSKPSKRVFQMDEKDVYLFSSLKKEHYQAILTFAKQEKWPITARGMVLLLQGNNQQESLKEAFFLSSEFVSLEMLFTRTLTEIKREELLKMVLEAPFDLLEQFYQAHRKEKELSLAMRRNLLWSYVEKGSKTSAYILLETDPNFALKKLNDQEILLLLSLLDQKNVHSEQFALDLLISPRVDKIWEMAARRLYDYHQEEFKEPYNHLDALNRFVSQTVLDEKIEKIDSEQPQKIVESASKQKQKQINFVYHTVQKGDSLWKISRKYKVSIEALKSMNQMNSDRLLPGKVLKVISKE